MVSVHDVAAYILSILGELTTMKLQKLVYYSQAWSLVWDEEPLFGEQIEAWVNGPIVRELYNIHKGLFKVHEWPQGNIDNLSESERETIDAVINYYGEKSAHWLSDLTHREQPWIDARRGLGEYERGDAIITHASMFEYYDSLQ